MTTPIWLKDEPWLAKWLDWLLGRLDKREPNSEKSSEEHSEDHQPARTIPRRIKINTLPALYDFNEDTRATGNCCNRSPTTTASSRSASTANTLASPSSPAVSLSGSNNAGRMNKRSHFWGDLDYAGMGILKALRNSLPNLQAWQPGYQPMLEILENGGGHTPEQAGKIGQNDPGETGCGYSDFSLLPSLRKQGRFVDQEITDAEKR